MAAPLSSIRAPHQLCDTCFVFNKTNDTCRSCDAEEKAEHPATPPAALIPKAPTTYSDDVHDYIIEIVEAAYAVLSRTPEALVASHEAYLATREELAQLYDELNSLEGKTAAEHKLVRETILTCEDSSVKLYLWHHGYGQ